MTKISVEVGDKEAADASLAFWAKCRKCAHCWPAAYYPLNLTTFANIAKRSTCPKCGDKKPVVAKQDSGVLMEDQPA